MIFGCLATSTYGILTLSFDGAFHHRLRVARRFFIDTSEPNHAQNFGHHAIVEQSFGWLQV
jgi:hypothetical protein